ncbi:MAG: hypothetical protein IKU30_06070 [Clostridia bacterium]|nr:hypothetical protein [Clostridia bacterium]
MSNSIYKDLNGNQPSQMANLQNALAQIKNDPVGVLRQAGLNIPAGMNNPQSIISYLLSSGQVNQARLAQAQQMAGRFKR